MRTELELIEKIEQYLSNQLSAADKAAFEAQLAADPSLRETFRLQQDILSGLDRISAQQAVRRARRRFHQTRYLTRWGGLGLGVIVAGILFAVLLHHNPPAITPGLTPSGPATTSIPAGITPDSAEHYTIDGTKDTTLKTAHGALLRIPRGSLDAGGAPSIQLEIKEAYSISAMIRNGLLTRSNGQPLSSGGMISIEAADGKAVRFLKPITVSIPTDRLQSGMQRYKGNIDNQGKIDWTNPVPLQDTSGLKDLAIGRSIFMTNCAACHSIAYPVTGPALAYIGQRRDQKWLYQYIRNNQLMLKGDEHAERDTSLDAGDTYNYAYCLYETYHKSLMTLFPNLTDNDLNHLIAYIDNESRLVDSNTVRDYKKEYDSCVYYNRLLEALEERRIKLHNENGRRTDVNWLDASGNPITSTHTTYVNTPPVIVDEHPSLYYKFTVESFGWYNVDMLVNMIPEAKESELRVHIRPEYSGEVNVFFVMPGRKILNEGGLLANTTDEFGFLTQDAKIPLPQNEQAYVFATGEYQGHLIFGISNFTTSLQQTIDLPLDSMTKEEMNATIDRIGFDHLSIRAADSKNAAQLRAIDTTLAAIARFKPKNCDCNCGMNIERDSTQ